MEKLILKRSFTQEVYILEIDESDFFPRYKMQFTLSPSSVVVCWLDFGNDKHLRVYDVEGRQTPESLAQFAEFVSHEQWLKELIELKTRY